MGLYTSFFSLEEVIEPSHWKRSWNQVGLWGGKVSQCWLELGELSTHEHFASFLCAWGITAETVRMHAGRQEFIKKRKKKSCSGRQEFIKRRKKKSRSAVFLGDLQCSGFLLLVHTSRRWLHLPVGPELTALARGALENIPDPNFSPHHTNGRTETMSAHVETCSVPPLWL